MTHELPAGSGRSQGPRNGDGTPARLSTLLAAALLMFCVGCGQDGPLRVPVTGEVLLGGQPLKQGSIVFVPADGTEGPKAGGAVVDGFYELSRAEGPVVGRHRVEIRAEMELPFALDDPEAFVAHASALPSGNPVPARYNERTELSVVTTAASNEFDFHLDAHP